MANLWGSCGISKGFLCYSNGITVTLRYFYGIPMGHESYLIVDMRITKLHSSSAALNCVKLG